MREREMPMELALVCMSDMAQRPHAKNTDLVEPLEFLPELFDIHRRGRWFLPASDERCRE